MVEEPGALKDRPAIRMRYVAFDGSHRDIDVPIGWTAMDGAIQYDLDGMMASCGGIGDCATCHVYVHHDFLARLPEKEQFEKDALKATATECLDNSRLACQIDAKADIDGIILYLPEKQL